jgi:hypothetical protein
MIAVDTEVPRQSERSDWRALERLLDEVASDSSRDSVPLLVKIAAWYIGLRLFRLLQDAYFYLQDPTELGKEYHRPLLKKLIGIGERLATASKR